jgi:hypothetical protein
MAPTHPLDARSLGAAVNHDLLYDEGHHCARTDLCFGILGTADEVHRNGNGPSTRRDWHDTRGWPV